MLKTTNNLKKWWDEFPSQLRRITICRFLASVGAGGVLYLTPLIFNNLSFTATQIGIGFCAAALAGTLTRLLTGICLDKAIGFEILLKIAAFLAILADLLLLNAFTNKIYLLGEIFLGAAAGFYWPSVEIAIPKCVEEGKSNEGFALARTADALGISIGALIGSFSATFGHIRLIYINEIICMAILLLLLRVKVIENDRLRMKKIESINKNNKFKELAKLIKILSPFLVISLLGTGILSLMQIGLQLDLVKGGIIRPSISSSSTGWIVAYKLILLLLFQWPIGKWLINKNFTQGLKLSLLNFLLGCTLLFVSSFSRYGLIIFLIGLIPISIGIAMFLPTATETIVQISPKKRLGLSMAIYSQCFGISFLLVPIIAGRLIDINGNALLVWLITAICCLLVYPLTNSIKRRPDLI